jgi:hypothetical protein
MEVPDGEVGIPLQQLAKSGNRPIHVPLMIESIPQPEIGELEIRIQRKSRVERRDSVVEVPHVILNDTQVVPQRCVLFIHLAGRFQKLPRTP